MPAHFARHEAGAEITELGGQTMGTVWSTRIVGAPPDARSAIEDVLDKVISQMSNWEPASDICRFNRTPPGEWCDLPEEMLHVLQTGLAIARESSGAFDPAIGLLVDYWGFGPKPGTRQASAGGWQAIEVEDGRARRTGNVALDFSGIAKGYAVDAIAERLKASGCDHFLFEIGGELRGHGVKPDLQPWWVDVEAPPGLDLSILRIALCDLSVATSGDYRRYREEGDMRISHSIDPARGAPISNSVASVTVLHPSAMIADAWATAITVLGPEYGMALAARKQLAVLMVERDGGKGREYISPALRAMLE